MGQKANPKGLRLGIVKDWDANWFAEDNYGALVLEDYRIRNYLESALDKAGVSKIEINRKSGYTEANVYVARAGIIFGKKGLDIDAIKEDLDKQVAPNQVRINIKEEKDIESNARLLGQWIAQQLERRIPFRRAMKMAVQKCMKAGALGIKVSCSGRLGGVEIARTEWYREGKVPLHTFRADIDYAFTEALTTYGKIGVKVWVYHGEILPEKKEPAKIAVADS